jgi:hypothetical protein
MKSTSYIHSVYHSKELKHTHMREETKEERGGKLLGIIIRIVSFNIFLGKKHIYLKLRWKSEREKVLAKYL